MLCCPAQAAAFIPQAEDATPWGSFTGKLEILQGHLENRTQSLFAQIRTVAALQHLHPSTSLWKKVSTGDTHTPRTGGFTKPPKSLSDTRKPLR